MKICLLNYIRRISKIILYTSIAFEGKKEKHVIAFPFSVIIVSWENDRTAENYYEIIIHPLRKTSRG